MAFNRNVFINCPFDDGYRQLLRPLLFTVYCLGFQPRIALESRDSGRPRIDKIVELIRESKYAIHDLSRIQATAVGEFFRLNMPFELGIDYGCRTFKSGRWSQKRCLILGNESHHYQAALSDISGSDIQAHDGRPEKVVREVRNWLNSHSSRHAAGPTKIWTDFHTFTDDTHSELIRQGHSEEDIKYFEIDELMSRMVSWLTPDRPRQRRKFPAKKKQRERHARERR
ncbi:MAG: hypothetical protein ABI885_06480 [Gammaproteobacteria bacterium]